MSGLQNKVTLLGNKGHKNDSEDAGQTGKENMTWHDSLEKIFSDLGDEAQINASLHQKSFKYYYRKSVKFQLPIIILSVLSGSGNFVSASFPDHQQMMILIIGGVSILTSVISSIAQFLKLSELSEAHRISYVSWEKFYSNIKYQMMRKRKDRDNIKEFLSNVFSEYQRLKEISPLIPEEIAGTIKRIRDTDMYIPFILNRFEHVKPYDDTPSPSSSDEDDNYLDDLDEPTPTKSLFSGWFDSKPKTPPDNLRKRKKKKKKKKEFDLMEQGLAYASETLDLENTQVEDDLEGMAEGMVEGIVEENTNVVEEEVRKLSVDFTEKLATLEKSIREQEIKLKESTVEKVSIAINTEEPEEPKNKVQANLMDDMSLLLDTNV
jgi:hypothetical protein